MEVDRRLAVTRVVKYLLEGIAVALVALMWLPAGEAVVVAAAAAAAFAVLDILLPSVTVERRRKSGDARVTA